MQVAEFKRTILVNGEDSAVFPVMDRGLQYGHGLFETIAISQGQLRYCDRHLARLLRGCNQLSIKPPDPTVIKNEATQLAGQAGQAVLKIIYTCGVGGRGYRTPANSQPNRILILSEWPAYPQSNSQTGVVLRLCETRLGSNQALAGLKHLNRLEQVIARSEWDDPDIAEGLMLDNHGQVIEGTMSNLFFVKNEILCTPSLTQSGVQGIIREHVLELAGKLGINTYIDDFTPADVFQAEEVFLTNSLIRIWPVNKILSEEPVSYDSPGIITSQLIAQMNKE